MSALEDRLKDVIAAGYTQKALAKASGLSKGAINQMMKGSIKSMKLQNAIGIETLTGFRAEWIVMGRGEKRNPHYAARSPADEREESRPRSPIKAEAPTDGSVETPPTLKDVANLVGLYCQLPEDARPTVHNFIRDQLSDIHAANDSAVRNQD